MELPADLAAPESGNLLPKRLAACLRPMIDGLPAGYAEPLRLTELDGLSQPEAARRLGLSLAALKSRVRRGRARLRATLLDCCHFEFTRAGAVLDYWPRGKCCAIEHLQPSVPAAPFR